MLPTIWDASKWAIHEGNHKVDYNHGSFVATYKNLILKGCVFDPIQAPDDEFCSENLKAQDYAIIKPLPVSKCKTSANISCPTPTVMIHIGTLSHHRSVLLFRKKNECLTRTEN